ncbi:MAG: DUF4826 family protein [Pseudomonadota bacterium]
MNESLAKASSNHNHDEWLKQQYHKAGKYLNQYQLGLWRVQQKESAFLAPFIALWKVEIKNGGTIWVLTGGLPSDHTNVTNLNHPRDALHHFALSWQLKAENLLYQLKSEQTLFGNKDLQKEYAETLVKNAEKMYQLANSDKHWK